MSENDTLQLQFAQIVHAHTALIHVFTANCLLHHKKRLFSRKLCILENLKTKQTIGLKREITILLLQKADHTV